MMAREYKAKSESQSKLGELDRERITAEVEARSIAAAKHALLAAEMRRIASGHSSIDVKAFDVKIEELEKYLEAIKAKDGDE